MRSLVWILARQSVDQARHDRLPWLVAGYALAAVSLVPLATHMSLGAGARAAWDTGLTLQWLGVSVAAGWLGLRGIGLDLSSRRAGLVLAGPVAPQTWLAGRWLGAALSLAALVVALQVVWLLVCGWRGLQPDSSLLGWSVLLWTEGAVVAALCGLLSTRMRPTAAAGATAALWVVGHLSGEYTRLMHQWGADAVATVLYTVVPDLGLLDAQAQLVRGEPLGLDQVGLALAYGTAWLVALGALTVTSLRTRDLA